MICICHFFNEAYLLPIWLKHHQSLFEKFIFIDHHSTDRSREQIARSGVPYEIISTQLEYFYAEATDREVMDIERRFPGKIKIVLNTTEFLMVRPGFNFEDLITQRDTQYVLKTWAVVDIAGNDPCVDLPVLEQYPYGFWCTETYFSPPDAGIHLGPIWYRDRIVHCSESGKYTVGRHGSRLPEQVQVSVSTAFIAWMGFCPMTQAGLERKVSTAQRVPKSDHNQGYGVHHITNTDLLKARSEYAKSISRHYRTAPMLLKYRIKFYAAYFKLFLQRRSVDELNLLYQQLLLQISP